MGVARQERDQSIDAVRQRCAASLMGFIREAWPVLEPQTEFHEGWALQAMAAHLEAVTNGAINRLLSNVPPGTMKSLMTSVFWPAWEWGPRDMPWLRYLTSSYERTLVIRDNTKMRRLVESDWYQKHWGDTVRLTSDVNAKVKFDNTASGGREGRAFGSMTGGRGDRVIIDDPHSVTTAESDNQRAEAVKLFRESISDRLNNEASAIIVIMQRLHEKDISGVILAEQLGYTHLCLPMEYEADRRCITSIGFADPRDTEGDGALLFPEQFPRSRVEVLRRDKGAYAWASQYQQRPAPREGGMFARTWFGLVKAAPANCQRVRRWDLAATEAKKGGDPDWSVGVLMAKDRTGIFYVEDVIRMRRSAHDVETAMRNTAAQDKEKYGPGLRTAFPQDPGQAGKMQAAHLARLLAGYALAPAERETGSKEVRATPFSAQCEAGNVKLVIDPRWNEEFLTELEMFPMAAHDDQVDAASGAFHLLSRPAGEGWFQYMEQRLAEARAGGG